MIDSITFNTAESKLTVTYQDGTSTDYTNRQTYLINWPDREADCDAMGWA
mgnify:CR=1 FL=1